MKNKLFLATMGGILLSATAVAGAQIAIRIGPPPRIVERRPPPPPEHRDWAWHPGYHRWDGHAYVWVPGVYEQPPRPHAIWVEGRWVNRHGNWEWREGHWR